MKENITGGSRCLNVKNFIKALHNCGCPKSDLTCNELSECVSRMTDNRKADYADLYYK